MRGLICGVFRLIFVCSFSFYHLLNLSNKQSFFQTTLLYAAAKCKFELVPLLILLRVYRSCDKKNEALKLKRFSFYAIDVIED